MLFYHLMDCWLRVLIIYLDLNVPLIMLILHLVSLDQHVLLSIDMSLSFPNLLPDIFQIIATGVNLAQL